MEQDLYVLFARPYNFTDKESGEQLEGVTIYYLNNLLFNSTREGYGYQPIKANIANMDSIKKVPGVYHAHFDITSNAKGLQLRLSTLDFIKEFDLWEACTKQVLTK